MIPELMNLDLLVDTTNRKLSVNGFYEDNETLFPYCVGYLPYDYVKNSIIFNKYTMPISLSTSTNLITESSIITQKPKRGLPFCYVGQNRGQYNIQGTSIKFNPENGELLDSFRESYYWINTQSTSAGNVYTPIIVSYNAEINLASVSTSDRTYYTCVPYMSIVVNFLFHSSPDNFEDGYNETARISISNINPVTGEWSAQIGYSNYFTKTITNEDWINNKDGVLTTEERTDGNGYVTYIWYIDQLGVYHSINANTTTLILDDNYRQTLGEYRLDTYGNNLSAPIGSYSYFNIVTGLLSFRGLSGFGCDSVNLTLDHSNPFLINEQSNVNTYSYVESSAPFKQFIFGNRYRPDDLRFMVACLHFFYYYGDENNPEGWYTGEFDDNYVLTGNVIHFDNWRDWQKNLNSESNSFNPDDIPIPVNPNEEDEESGDKIPNQFGKSVGVASNFVTQYLLTSGQIAKFGEILWTSWTDEETSTDMLLNFYKVLQSETGSWNISTVLNYIVSCRLFPMSLPTLLSTTPTSIIRIGTGNFGIQCGTIREPGFFIANSSVAVLNCGSVYIPTKYNDFRDYDNTNITVYLPFCGSVQLSPGDVVGKYLGCTYAIDLFDGSCKAFLYTLAEQSQSYQDAYYNVAIKTGQCGFTIPLSATNAGQVESLMKIQGYTSGLNTYNSLTGFASGIAGIAMGDLGKFGSGVNQLVHSGMMQNINTARQLGHSGISAPILTGGSSFADFMQPAKPYIQIRRSIYQEPLEYENTVGYPSDSQLYNKVSDFNGFTVFNNVEVSGMSCHEDERNEIKALLESGIYV